MATHLGGGGNAPADGVDLASQVVGSEGQHPIQKRYILRMDAAVAKAVIFKQVRLFISNSHIHSRIIASLVYKYLVLH